LSSAYFAFVSVLNYNLGFIAVEGSVSTPISTVSYGTTSALNKEVSRAKFKLPKDPTKFADVLMYV
jgi:hypothetical protein